MPCVRSELRREKDLGKTTAETATGMSEFDPDAAGALWGNDQFPSFAPAEANAQAGGLQLHVLSG